MTGWTVLGSNTRLNIEKRSMSWVNSVLRQFLTNGPSFYFLFVFTSCMLKIKELNDKKMTALPCNNSMWRKDQEEPCVSEWLSVRSTEEFLNHERDLLLSSLDVVMIWHPVWFSFYWEQTYLGFRFLGLKVLTFGIINWRSVC